MSIQLVPNQHHTQDRVWQISHHTTPTKSHKEGTTGQETKAWGQDSASLVPNGTRVPKHTRQLEQGKITINDAKVRAQPDTRPTRPERKKEG
jgi:hypothetical protein